MLLQEEEKYDQKDLNANMLAKFDLNGADERFDLGSNDGDAGTPSRDMEDFLGAPPMNTPKRDASDDFNPTGCPGTPQENGSFIGFDDNNLHQVNGEPNAVRRKDPSIIYNEEGKIVKVLLSAKTE